MSAVTRRVYALLQAQRWGEVIAVGQAAIAAGKYRETRASLVELNRHVGLALLQTPSGSRSENVEAAIAHLRAAADGALDAWQKADVLMHTAFGYDQRLEGDPSDNLEEALSLLSDALQAAPQGSLELIATIHTNLARCLRRRQQGDRSQNLRRSRAHAEAALALRSPTGDTESWAYSQLNLADTLDVMFQSGEADRDEVRAAWEAIVDVRDQIASPWLVGNALSGLAASYRSEAAAHEEEEQEGERLRCLRVARTYLEEAVELTSSAPDATIHGRAVSALGSVVHELDDDETAARLLDSASQILRVDNAPANARDTAWELASLHADAGRWAEAASAFQRAIAAARVTFDARVATTGRESELRQTHNLFRFAAYALARAGAIEEAVVALEEGRAQELRRRMGPPTGKLEELQVAAPDLRSSYLNAAERLLRSDLGEESDQASRELRQVVERIRSVEGFGGFGNAVELGDIAAAARPGRPLVYINPAPHGTVIFLLVQSAPETPVEVRTKFLDLGSQEVFLRVMAGDYEDRLDEDSPSDPDASGYLGTASGLTPVRSLQAALDFALPWFGENLARAVADELEAVGAAGATLIVCGPLGTFPLHAASWPTTAGRRSLIDEFAVSYAPSATVCVGCYERAAARGDEVLRLVAIANPEGDLPAAEGEVQSIVALAGGGDVAIGDEATSAFLAARAGHASHLHLACHARGNPLELDESVVRLADVALPLRQIAGALALRTRLVVASACQTAIPSIRELPDEIFSVSSAFLAAGSAGVVASLWEVDDFATALLMTRLYEFIAGDAELRPAAALRQAQLWLRDLGEEAEEEFLDRYPELREAFRRRGAADALPGRRGGGRRGARVRPYAHPDFWAAFAMFGE